MLVKINKTKKLIIKRNNFIKNEQGITLIALVITIVLLILAAVSIATLTGQNGILTQANNAKDNTVIAEEKEQVETSYLSAITNKLGETVYSLDLQDELNKTVGMTKTRVTTNGDGSLNVLFYDTEHNFNVNNGEVKKVEIDKSTMAMFDTGINVKNKIHELAKEGEIHTGSLFYEYNLSIDAIKRYSGTPDLSSMTEANIVSWTDMYNIYEQDPDAYASIIPKGTKLCPIYMWFEESGKKEIRNISGDLNLTEVLNNCKEVKTGTIYWWCESDNVYLNFDSSTMFGNLPYLADISGLQSLKTEHVTNMQGILCTTHRK